MANAILIPAHAPVAIAASSTSVGAAANLLNDYAGVVWSSGVGNLTSLTIDLGSDQLLDTIALFGVWGNFGASAYVGIALSTEAQGNSTYWTSPAYSLFAGTVPIAAGNGVTLVLLDGADRPKACRYVTVTFGSLGSGGSVKASRLVIGQALRLERNFSYGASFGVRDLGSLDFSSRGVLLRRRGAKLRTVGLTFASIRKDEVEAQVQPLLERIGNTEMVALVTDPAADAQRQRRCYFGPLVGDLGTTRRNAAAFEAKANLVSVF